MVAGSLCTLYPYLEETGLIDAFIPKKSSLTIAKWCAAASRAHAVVTVRSVAPPQWVLTDTDSAFLRRVDLLQCDQHQSLLVRSRHRPVAPPRSPDV